MEFENPSVGGMNVAAKKFYPKKRTVQNKRKKSEIEIRFDYLTSPDTPISAFDNIKMRVYTQEEKDELERWYSELISLTST